MLRSYHIALLFILAAVSCRPLETVWTFPASDDREISIQGYLHGRDSIHSVWCSYAKADGAVEAADLDVAVYVNGKLVDQPTSTPSDYPYLHPAEYTFKAFFSPGDRIKIKTGDACAAISVPEPPDTLYTTMNVSKGLDGVSRVKFESKIQGNGYYRIDLRATVRGFNADGHLVSVSQVTGPSQLFSMDNETTVQSIMVPLSGLKLAQSVKNTAYLECTAIFRISAMNRELFTLFNTWAEDSTEDIFSRFADQVHFPNNVQGGIGLVDVTSEVERSFTIHANIE